MNLCIKALDEHLCNLELPATFKYAYLKLCATYPLFCEFYIFKPTLADEWEVAPKSIERYFSSFEKHKLFARNHKKSKEVGRSGLALYGTLTPPIELFSCPPIITLEARLTDKETSVVYGAGEFKHVWLTNNESYKHNLTIPIADIRNLTAEELAVVDNLEIGDRVLFEAEVEVALEGSKVKAKIISRPTNLRSAYA